MLTVRDLRRPGIEPATVCVDGGDGVAIMGPSGAGKTLLLRAIADLDPNQGEVMLDDRPRSTIPGPSWRRQVVYLPAESGWWAESVGEHVRDHDEARHLARRLGFSDDVLAWPVSRLSTGEKQRLALVRALSLKPPVLLLDEPTAALDSDSAAAVEALVRERLASGAAVILVTHDRGQAERLAFRILTMCGGRIAEGNAERAAPPS